MTSSGKIFTTIVSVILIVTGAVVCILRWTAWFGNSPEPPYKVPTEPNNIVLTYGANATYSRIISWRADTILKVSSVELYNPQTSDTLVFLATGEVIKSRAGKAAYYRVSLDSLSEGQYSYRCMTDSIYSDWYKFYISTSAERDSLQRFVLFGDIQDRYGRHAQTMFDTIFSESDTLNLPPTAMVFVGDIIERPTDYYWQIFFTALHNRQSSIPIIAATGNHEYLKGVIKTLDGRWTHIFGNPDNGPVRFSQTTYYIDFEHCRFIILDTDALHLLSDYTVMQTWLMKVLSEREDAWKIVVMHHPLYSAGKNRCNPLLWLSFNWILSEADIVFCGHDHCYYRRTADIKKPVYILTNSSEKFYDSDADNTGSDQSFYEEVFVCQDSIVVHTFTNNTKQLFDSVVIRK